MLKTNADAAKINRKKERQAKEKPGFNPAFTYKRLFLLLKAAGLKRTAL